MRWTPSRTRCCALGCSWIEARDGKEEVGLQEPQPLELRILPASSQLLVRCLGLVPCSGKLRLCAELCLLFFFIIIIIKKIINPAVLAVGKKKAWERELSWLQENKQSKPTRQTSERPSHHACFETLEAGGGPDRARLVPAWPGLGPAPCHWELLAARGETGSLGGHPAGLVGSQAVAGCFLGGGGG